MIAKLLAGTAVLTMLLTSLEECNVGGRPGNVDDPEQGTQQCAVVDRQINSNNTAYLKVDCNGGDPADAQVRGLMTHDEWPKCRPGAFWPECKTQ